ncbi:hypothetical protein J0X19_21840 [Hymenobacter sp. BT186]|uniref:Uncharacterized protein n=1 Tax=Hymenobacter telluris TaxID=2816474 RepID=A0A939F002_9BACT|nr:hypothetical protein [Hymenobacter telluris]MBO0360618.1 hypothetical protein [Hymenobacter telluris]MBW3376645.1 hypothetical protein [Hymenobacter norwichensis]
MKRPLSHRLFSVWLALLVLTASVGMTVQQHVCRESGSRTASVVFTTPQHRCPAPKPASEQHTPSRHAKLKGACCEFSAHLHKLDAPTPELTWAKLLPTPFVAVCEPTFSWPTLPPVLLIAQAEAWHAADSSPPLRAGRTLLTFIGVLVI